jgi:hypothetical protein
MALFRSPLHQDIWMEHHCGRCYFGNPEVHDGCRILDRALRTDRKPVEWERNTRKGALMADTMKCNMETHTPPKYGGQRTVTDETMGLFEVETPDAAMDSDHA